MNFSEQKFYYEALLIQAINSIKEKRSYKLSLSTFFTVATFLLTIFGFSEDSIGYLLISKMWFRLNINFSIEYVMLLPTLMLLANTLFMLLDYKIRRRNIVFDSILEPFWQKKILRGFLLSKYLKDNNITIKKDNNIINFVIDKDYQVNFAKHDLRMYISDCLIPLIGREYILDIMRYLSELVIINGSINKLIFTSFSKNGAFISVIKKELFTNMYSDSRNPLRIKKIFG